MKGPFGSSSLRRRVSLCGDHRVSETWSTFAALHLDETHRFPLISITFNPGYIFLICAILLTLEVPTTAP